MYSPTTRLLTMLELLQSYRQMSGSEMARRLEVDGRTIRRYIVMLQDMGIPVEAERGPYGTYRLRRGYKLPPLMFTDAEAVALTLGLLAIRELRFPVDVAAIEGALAKTERVMPDKLLAQARALQQAITFNPPDAPSHQQVDLVAALSSAVQQRQQVRLRYRAWNGDDSERMFDPYGIVFNDGYWYTAGHCHLRGDLRTFRFDRIVALETGDQAFDVPPDFDTLAHVMNSLSAWQGTDEVVILMKTTLENARQAVAPLNGRLERSDDGVIFRRAAYQLEWVAHVLLGVTFPVVVKQPDALRDLLRTLAARALSMLEEDA